MDKKLTDNEIVKALECISGKAKDLDCDKCTFDGAICTSFVAEKALYLINRLQAIVEKSEKVEHFADKTIATLQAENKRLTTLAELGNTRANDYRVMRDRALKAEAENERLKTNLNIELENYATEYDNKIKAEAYKEFADRLKEKYGYYDWENKTIVYPDEEIDNLLKELGENDAR